MDTYQKLRKFADTRRARKLANNTYLVELPDGGLRSSGQLPDERYLQKLPVTTKLGT